MTILIFVLVLLALIVSHEAGHAVAAWLSGCRVEEFGVGFPPKIFGKKIGETLFSVNWLPLGGFVKITGEDEDAEVTEDPKSFANKPAYKKLFILLAGIGMNIVLAIFIYSFIAAVGSDIPSEGLPAGTPTSNARIEIVGVEDNEMLKNSGINEGDIILLINNKPVSSATEAASSIKNFEGEQLVMQVRRDEVVKEIKIEFNGNHEKGKPVGLALLDMATYKVPLWQAPLEGVRSTWRVVVLTAKGLGGLLSNLVINQQVPKDVAGPVGIASIVGSVGREGFLPLMELVAVLSVNLALINVLPIPALDGGRVFFVILETLGLNFFKGKRERIAHSLGFFLLILLVLLITINDIRRIFHP